MEDDVQVFLYKIETEGELYAAQNYSPSKELKDEKLEQLRKDMIAKEVAFTKALNDFVNEAESQGYEI